MNKKAMEIQTLVIVVIGVVFLLVMLTIAIILFTQGNPFTGESNLCERTGGFIRGCT
jgi:hypothetical protein